MTLVIRLFLIVVIVQLIAADFTNIEHEAFKTLERNPMMDNSKDEHEYDFGNFKDELEGVVDKLCSCRKFPGGSVAVIKPGKGLFTAGYGRNHKRSNSTRRISSNSNFQIHTVTHSFTAVLLIIVLSEYNDDNPDR